MRVAKDEQIAGVPATDLRRAFRGMRDEMYRRLDDLRAAVGASLGLRQVQAKATAAQLIAEETIPNRGQGILKPSGLSWIHTA
jgi:hypothetical protein